MTVALWYPGRMPGGVDNRSPDQAYTTKDNIVVPVASEYGASTAHATATVERAAAAARVNVPPMPTTYAGATTAVNETRAIKGRG